jgi:hypothetical protein
MSPWFISDSSWLSNNVIGLAEKKYLDLLRNFFKFHRLTDTMLTRIEIDGFKTFSNISIQQEQKGARKPSIRKK